MAFSHTIAELSGITLPILADEHDLAALVIAAAGSIGLTAHGPPTARTGPRGITIGLLADGGHVVLHAQPAAGICLVDVVTSGGIPPTRAVDVIARRLGVTVPAP
jgi:S-adenosylmethionine/arginine decarboxylase-like enzyme